jgi:hypothetical protein
MYSNETGLTFMHYAHPFDRENILEGLIGKGLMVLVTISSAALGFFLGAEMCEKSLYEYAARKIIYGK